MLPLVLFQPIEEVDHVYELLELFHFLVVERRLDLTRCRPLRAVGGGGLSILVIVSKVEIFCWILLSLCQRMPVQDVHLLRLGLSLCGCKALRLSHAILVNGRLETSAAWRSTDHLASFLDLRTSSMNSVRHLLNISTTSRGLLSILGLRLVPHQKAVS